MKELGDLFRGAREARGIPVEQAAAETRIRRAYIDAMEDGDFRLFPGAAYISGFLRNYATYLGLNCDEVLQTYHVLSPPAAISIAPATTVGVERLRRRTRRRLLWSGISVLVVALAAYGIKSYSNSGTPLATHGPRIPAGIGGFNPSLVGHTSHDADQPPLKVVHPTAVVRVEAQQTAWVRVVKNGHQLYWGPIQAGTTKKWTGHTLRLETHRGPAFKVWVDGTRAWHISKSHGRVILIAGPYTWYHKR